MHERPRRFSPLLLSLVVLAASCDAGPGPAATGPSALAPAGRVAIRVEPATVTPEVVETTTCAAFPPFRTTLVVIVTGPADFFVRQLLFRFTDSFGKPAIPAVWPIVDGVAATVRGGPLPGFQTAPASAPTALPGPTTIPTSYPIPFPAPATLPASSPIPVPGFGSFTDSQSSTRGFGHLPFLLEFACGVQAVGTLTIEAETSDSRGRTGTSSAAVRVGR